MGFFGTVFPVPLKNRGKLFGGIFDMAKNKIVGKAVLRVGLIVNNDVIPIGSEIECTQSQLDMGYFDMKTFKSNVKKADKKEVKEPETKKVEIKDNKKMEIKDNK